MHTPVFAAEKGRAQRAPKGDDMSESPRAADTAPVGNPAATRPATEAQPRKVITDPREIAAIVMAQMGVVNAKKEDLAKAIKTLTDMTQQLVVAYAQQARFIERLAQRAKALEVKPNGSEPSQRAA
jgi:flagellum-specific peptidoglycan hydrolase FlgJ